MDITPRLDLPLLMPQQAQKHVTVNESLARLDMLVQLTVISSTLAVEPSSPPEGGIYILPAGAGGTHWMGKPAGTLAAFTDGAWQFVAPKEGWRACVQGESTLLIYSANGWKPAIGSSAPQFGVNTQPDAVNRFAVKSNAELLSHDDVTPGSGDARKIINRAAQARTASVVFQTDYSGRAEFGLIGDDRLRLKVSSDGASFSDALVIEPVSGHTGFGAVPKAQVFIAGSNTSDAEKGDLHIEKSGYFALLFLDTYASAGASFSVQRRARGTAAAPLSVQTGDMLGGFSFRGRTPSGAFSQTGLVYAVVDDVVSGTEAPGALVFATGRSSAGERMRITSSGRMGIGTQAPSCALHVTGPVRVGASTKTALPSASSTGEGALIFVSDESGGSVLAFSDGVTWRRVTDRSVVS